MIKTKLLLSALTVTITLIGLSVPSTQAFAQRKHTYHCNGTPAPLYKGVQAAAKAKTNDFVIIQYFYKKVEIWDANYILEGCKALMRGEEHDDSCLNGRRPLKQIANDIPENVYTASKDESLRLLGEIKRNEDYQNAFAFCRANGIYK